MKLTLTISAYVRSGSIRSRFLGNDSVLLIRKCSQECRGPKEEGEEPNKGMISHGVPYTMWSSAGFRRRDYTRIYITLRERRWAFVLPPQTLVTEYSVFWREGNKALSYFWIFPWSSLVFKSQPQKFHVLAVNNKAHGSQMMGWKMWEDRSHESELGTNQVLLLGVFNFQKIIWFPGDLEVEVGQIKL